MKVLAVTIRVKKEKVDIAKKLFQSFLAPSRAESGCVQYDLFQSLDDVQIFYFFEKWQDAHALKVHGTQVFLKDFHDRFEELLEEPNKLMWLNPLEPN